MPTTFVSKLHHFFLSKRKEEEKKKKKKKKKERAKHPEKLPTQSMLGKKKKKKKKKCGGGGGRGGGLPFKTNSTASSEGGDLNFCIRNTPKLGTRTGAIITITQTIICDRCCRSPGDGHSVQPGPPPRGDL